MTARTCSSRVIWSRNPGRSIVAVIMNEKGVDLDGALDWFAENHGQILFSFGVQYLIARFLGVWQPTPMLVPL
jgi:hypothetical protein